MARDYLRNHLVVETDDLDQARVAARAAAIDARYTALNAKFFFRLSGLNLERTGLVYYRCSPIAVEGQVLGASYSLLMHEDGHAHRRLNGQEVTTSAKAAALMSAGHDEVACRIASTHAFNLRFDRAFVDPAFRQRFPGAPPLQDWPRLIATDRGAGATLRSFVRWFSDQLDDPTSGLRAAPRTVDHVEKALRTLFLESLAPSCPSALADERHDAAPRAVRRVEEWIDAHYAEPVAIEELAAIAGLGVRGLQRAFRRHRGHTPMAALSQRRIEAARALLRDPGPAATVTTVALDVGFCHLGRFAARYLAAFGERPSATLARARAAPFRPPRPGPAHRAAGHGGAWAAPEADKDGVLNPPRSARPSAR